MALNLRRSPLATILLCAIGLVGLNAFAAPPAPTTNIRSAVDRSLVFLRSDTAAWRRVHTCATCHHGVMTMWALNEAKRRGFAVSDTEMTDLLTWMRPYAVPDPSKPVDRRPGYSTVNLLSVWLADAARNEAPIAAVTNDDLGKIALHATQRQDADGSWFTDTPQVAIPPVNESREVMTLWTLMALPSAADNGTTAESRAKAIEWLARTKSSGTSQATALRLIACVRVGDQSHALRDLTRTLLRRRNPDGGWSADIGLPSDAFSTGEALYALGLVGKGENDRDVRAAVAFLISTQRPDGSWSMTPRPAPGRPACKDPSPISHIGTAWATLGLLTVLPDYRSARAR